MKTLRAELSEEGRHDIMERVMSYRGGTALDHDYCTTTVGPDCVYAGYAQEDRRRIEAQAFSGQLLGIVATNALELGVDIGVLDAVLMLGFPFGIASLVSLRYLPSLCDFDAYCIRRGNK